MTDLTGNIMQVVAMNVTLTLKTSEHVSTQRPHPNKEIQDGEGYDDDDLCVKPVDYNGDNYYSAVEEAFLGNDGDFAHTIADAYNPVFVGDTTYFADIIVIMMMMMMMMMIMMMMTTKRRPRIKRIHFDANTPQSTAIDGPRKNAYMAFLT
ncbi:hypothetical protein DPMN_014417 [Dreissena polymorpha]|uniref:Uncharacterized protein n=1 Tax=Dreissena polymorpha TaxID=45954 RepID=A0A9D4S2P5_DREPO|nr:hypothetical protein DPMN_014417 [Dreissena polymorpha]